MSSTDERTITILIADDDPTLRLIAGEALTSEGFDVAVAENGLEAVTIFDSRPVDLVLLDVQMPTMDGFTACQKIRTTAHGERIPVVMLTAMNDVGAIRRAYEAGATDFFPKPINWTILMQRVQYMLRASQSVEAWLASEQENRALLDAIPDSILRFDSDGLILNARVPTGSSCEGIDHASCGRSVTEVLAPEIAYRYLHHVSHALAEGASQFEYEFTGAERPHHYEARLVAVSQNEVLAMVRDVTDEKELATELMRSQKMEALGRLTSGIAHDFNNVLTVISGFAQLISMDSAQDEKLRHNVDRIIQAADHATILTRQLTSFSKQEASQPKVLDINTLITDLQAILGRMLGSDVEFRVQLEPNLPAVKIDKVQIEQVLLNLAVNARDAMPRGGELTIATTTRPCRVGEETQDKVCLSIADTGIGIPNDVIGHIFDPFYSTKQQGTGLGLANCHRIIRDSGGTIEVESREGEGTKFTILLPSAEHAGLADTPAERSSPRELRGSETVLLAEDDALVRELVAQALEPLGYRVLVTASGLEALELSRDESTIDVLLADVVMPGLSGPELAARLRIERPGISVLYMSGNSGDALVRYGVVSKDVMLLRKPFSPETLAAGIRRAIEQGENDHFRTLSRPVGVEP